MTTEMSDNETVDDVLADMLLPRFDAITAMRANNYDEIKSLVANYRDRIEAAYKRELSKICPKTGADFGQLGDAAAMREALKTVKRYFDGYTVNVPEMRSQVDVALAAPPRNCDVGTAEEQSKRFKFSKCDEPPKCRPWDECCLTCFAKWAQMPYVEKEGGNDEQK